MSEDVSLDEFLGGEESDENAVDESASEEASEHEDRDGGEEVDAADPAVSTYDWSPDGAECAECGETVERRWRDDGELVCADCKEW